MFSAVDRLIFMLSLVTCTDVLRFPAVVNKLDQREYPGTEMDCGDDEK